MHVMWLYTACAGSKLLTYCTSHPARLLADVMHDASHLASCCCAGSCVQWGAWASLGMASASPALLARIERSGMGVIAPASGLAALHAVLSSSSGFAPQTIASPFSWGRLLRRADVVPPVFGECAVAVISKQAEQRAQRQRAHVSVVVHASSTVLPQVLGIVRSMLGSEVGCPNISLQRVTTAPVRPDKC